MVIYQTPYVLPEKSWKFYIGEWFFFRQKMLELGVYSYGPLPEKVSEITP